MEGTGNERRGSSREASPSGIRPLSGPTVEQAEVDRHVAVPPSLRRAQILDRIRRDGGATVAELTRAHAVSPVTVHRDLEELSRKGLVERVHGGARAPAVTGAAPTIPTGWSERADSSGVAKAAIAARAARLVTPGATIFLDASSTGLALARRLMVDPPDQVTLVTNSPAIAYEVRADSMHVVVTPGELDQHMRLLGGRWTVEFLSELRFAVAFVSAAGVTLDHGLTTARRPLADVLSTVRSRADVTVGLLDSSKFGRSALLSIMRAQDLDHVITDDDLPADVADRFRAAGVRIDIANTKEDE